MKRPLERTVIRQPEFTEYPLGREVAGGSIVLMYRMHCHTIARCSRRLGQRVAKGVMPFVGYANPVHRAQYDRLVRTEQHNAAATESQFVEPPDRIIGHHRPQGWRRVDVKDGELDHRFRRVKRDQRAPAAARR